MFNRVILIGRVGKDPDVRNFDGGGKSVSFSLATSQRGYKRSDGTEVPERTEWHNVVVRGENACNFAEKYVKKGSGVKIEGEIRYREYDDKDDIKRRITEIYTNDVSFFSFGSKPNDNGNSGSETSSSATSAPKPDAPPAGVDNTFDLPF